VARKKQATSTKSRKTFLVNIQRATYFLDIHEEIQKGKGAPPTPYRELPRGAVVFAIGALDTYLSEVSAEIIVRDLQNKPSSNDAKEVLKRIHQDAPTIGLELCFLATQSERVTRAQDLITDYFHNKVSMHGSKAVSATAGRIGSKAQDIWSALESSGMADCRQNLDDWTEVRHKIVHQGKRESVTRTQAREVIKLVTAIAETIDKFALKT